MGGAKARERQDVDLQGAIVTVLQAADTTQIGVCGLVIHETPNTLQLITVDNAIKRIPKRSCEVTFQYADSCRVRRWVS